MRALLLLLALAAPLCAEEVIGALSTNEVAITAGFNGTEIWIFGAVGRDAPVPEGVGPAHVVITVSGPPERVTVRRKERTLGIWVNRDS
ncbi:MAG: TIGR02186 family protein, partial [Pseudomonadota bacterium]